LKIKRLEEVDRNGSIDVYHLWIDYRLRVQITLHLSIQS